MSIKATVIILNYFGEKILPQTLDSLLKSAYPASDFEIIIVDNNSTDNSWEIISQYTSKHPQLIKSLLLDKNLGFAGGNNAAIKIAHGEYIILLNNDCFVQSNWLSELITTADSDQNIFSVTSKIKRVPESLNEIQNAGSIVFQDGYGREIGANITKDHQQLYEKDDGQFSTPKEIYAGCGASVLYRKSILDKIGLLDEHFFMYYEDTEISERALLSGYKNFYCPTAVVYHHHSVSSKEWSPFFIYHVEKGRLLHLLFHFPLTVFFQQYFLFTFKSKIRLAKSLIRQKNISKSWQYLRVSLYFLIHFFELLSHRQSFTRLYSPSQRQSNFSKILSGYWYFN